MPEELRIESAPDAPITERLKPQTPLHGQVLGRLTDRRDYSEEFLADRRTEWNRVKRHLRFYIDLTEKTKLADKTTDSQDLEMPFKRAITIPLSAATLEVYLTQLMSIFTARDPIFQIKGRAPEDIFSARLVEALLTYDAQQTKAFSAMYSMFHDAIAYGNGITYDSWEIEEGIKHEFEPLQVPGAPPGLLAAVLGPLAYTPMRRWGIKREYNRWRPVDPFSMRPDPRVALSDLQGGEFFGHKFEASYNTLLKKSGERGPYFNVENLPARAGLSLKNEDKEEYGINELTADSTSHDVKDRGYYNCETMTVELIPWDWELGESTMPEKWIFAWAEDDVIIRANPLANAHDQFPYSVAEPNPDFHSTFGPGVIENIEPMQRFINWLFNSHVENIASMLNNQWAYSPKFIQEMDLEYGGPGQHIRLTNDAVEMMLSGEIQDVKQFLWQVPAQDVTGPSYMNAVQYVYQMAQLLTSVNDPLSGVQTPTERSATEIQTITAKASDRVAIKARLMDENAMQPLIQRAIANRQQFTQMQQYYNIGGQLAKDLMMESIFIDMRELQGQYDYVPITGILPEDPARSAQVWANVMAAAAQIPMLQQPGPDGRMLDFREVFNTVAEKQGIQNIDRYYMNVNVMPDQQVAQQEQAGNMVPLPEPQGMLPPGAM
jgi:hypothetical protein